MEMSKFLYNCLHKSYRGLTKPIRILKTAWRIKNDTKRLDLLSHNSKKHRVYYLGITAHSNLGDMAQHYCICKWIDENYPDYELVKFESDTVVDPRFGWIEKFKRLYRPQDIIIFQSGYTTEDLGGNHEEMHRLICDNLPSAKILMMPQTIFFQSQTNKQRCSKSYDQARNMLFLARDNVSFKMAKEMFPHLQVKAFPDIVTTLIGKLHFNNPRHGVCLCRRNDGEKFYTEVELKNMCKKIEEFASVTLTDTTIKVPFQELRSHMQKYIEREIEKFSHYQVTITDRYHGTIFSLVAGTPVIIIKTTDHKVTTGADWFKGVYDDYVYVAKDLNDAAQKAYEICNGFEYKQLQPYFKKNYYNGLKELFENIQS